MPIGDRNSAYQLLATLLLFPIVLLSGQTTNPVELIKQATPPANERIPYDKEPLLFGELRLPDGAWRGQPTSASLGDGDVRRAIAAKRSLIGLTTLENTSRSHRNWSA